MKVIVNYPQTKEGMELLETNVAKFKATLVLENIKSLNTSNNNKREILEGIFKELKG